MVLEETERNLAQKAPEALDAYGVFRDLLSAKLVNPTRHHIVNAAKVVAVKDAEVLAAAVEAKVDYLATYDRRHFLNSKEQIKASFGLIAATPDEILSPVK